MGDGPVTTVIGGIRGAQPAGARTTPAVRTRSRLGLLGLGYWLAPSLICLGYGLWQLGRPALWADELATWGAVRLSWHGLFQLLGNVDAVVAPYYVVEKLWVAVAGTSTVALRLPSVLAMAAAAGLVAVSGARYTAAEGGDRRWVGLLAGTAFAVVPTTSRYAQEARPYAFVIFFAVLASLQLYRLLERPTRGRAAGYALAVLLIGAFHLIALVLLAGHAVAVLLHRDRRALPAWVAGAAAGVVPLVPLAWLGRGQTQQIDWITPTHWREIVFDTPKTIFGAKWVALILVLLAVVTLVRRRRVWVDRPEPGHPEPVVLLASWAVVPILALLAAGEATPLFWPRYLLFVLPAVALLAALALGRFPRLVGVAVLLVVALAGVPAQGGIRQPDGHNHATSAAGAIIARGERPGDAVAYATREGGVPWEPRDIVARYVPTSRRPADIFAVTPQRTDGKLLATECADPAACLDRADPQRIWLVRYEHLRDPLAHLGQPKEDLLRSRYHVSRVWLVRGLTVALLVKN